MKIIIKKYVNQLIADSFGGEMKKKKKEMRSFWRANNFFYFKKDTISIRTGKTEPVLKKTISVQFSNFQFSIFFFKSGIKSKKINH